MAEDNLNVYMTSAGTGEPLVLLHGFMGSTKTWATHIPVFSQHYQVIVLDLPGHGATDTPTETEHYTMGRCLDILWAILEYMKIDQTHLLGYSMGGRVALSFAVKYPERIKSLILESASPGLATEAEREERIASDQALADMIEQDGMEAFVNYWQDRPLFDSQKQLPHEVQAKLRADRLRNKPAGLANSLRNMGVGSQDSLWDKLSEVQIPTLLLAGTLDTKYVTIVEKMAARMPNGNFDLIPDAGHAIHLEQSAAFDARVLEFLSACSD